MLGFHERKALIVVYKDEMLLNQLKKLVETNDDQISSEDGEVKIVGTVDDSISIISWTEKVWLDNKKSGNLKGKVLFLGDIQGTKMLTPVIDIKFDRFGVKYGWAGDQAVVFADVNAMNEKEEYQKFLSELNKLPVPQLLKPPIQNAKQQEPVATDEKQLESGITEEKQASQNIFGIAFGALATGINAIGKAGGDLVHLVSEIFKDKGFIERQLLFYGVFQLYENHLQAFMDE